MTELKYKKTEMQEKVFTDTHQYIVLAKGRRAGATRGAAIYTVKYMLSGDKKLLWVDTIQANLSIYYELYFLPLLAQLPKTMWSWNESKKILKVGTSSLIMRSAEKPENIEGFGYNRIICNESGIIFKDNNSLWYNSIAPMCLDYHAQVWFIGTPKGKIDKAGKEHLFFTFYKKGVSGDPNWISYNFSTYDNPFLKKEDIQELEKEIPVLVRGQEMGGKFIDESLDSIFKEEWFRFITKEQLPKPEEIIRTIISFDTAFKTGSENDFSCGVVFLQTASKFIAADLWVDRVTFPDLIKATKKLVKKWSPNCIVVEDKASGQSLIQSFQQTTLPVIPFKSSTDKLSRFSAVTPLLSERKVCLLEGSWTKDLINQAVLAPNGEYDDQIDAFCIGLLYMTVGALWSKSRPPVGKKITRASESLNGYDGQDTVVPVKTNDVPVGDAYMPSVLKIRPHKQSVLEGY